MLALVKDFFFTSCGSLIPFARANAQWVIHGFNEHFNLHFRVFTVPPFVFLVLRDTALIMYVPLLSLCCSSPPKSYPTFSVRPRSSVSRVMIDLIRRSWVRFPQRSENFFFTSCGSLFPFARANAQWVIHGIN